MLMITGSSKVRFFQLDFTVRLNLQLRLKKIRRSVFFRWLLLRVGNAYKYTGSGTFLLSSLVQLELGTFPQSNCFWDRKMWIITSIGKKIKDSHEKWWGLRRDVERRRKGRPKWRWMDCAIYVESREKSVGRGNTKPCCVEATRHKPRPHK